MARYLVAGGSGNWNNNNNWSAASGGAPGASFPVSTDDVIIDAASANANITVNVASACLSFTVSGGHTGTLTYNQALTVSGNVTYDAAMTIAGTNTLAVNATATITSAGKTHTGNITFNGTTTTITLGDNWTINGNLTFQNTGAGTPLTINGNAFNVGGNLSVHSAGNRITAGTTVLNLTGTGKTWSAGSTSELRLTTNITGTYTGSGTNTVTYGTGTLTISTGTLTMTSLVIRSSCTLNMPGITLTTLSCTLVSTITLSSSINVTTVDVSANITFAGTGVFTTANLTISGGSVASRTLTLVSGQTYYVTTAIESTVGTNAAKSTLKSSSAGTKANLILTSGITQNNVYINITDIDSSGGATGWVVNGTLSNTTNWNVLQTTPITITYSN